MALSSYFNKLFNDPSSYPRAASDEDIRALLQGRPGIGRLQTSVPAALSDPRPHLFRRPADGPGGFSLARAPDGTPYTFMAQVDCSELPDFQLRNFLPGSGVLHFFVNWAVFDGLEEAQSWPNHVVFSRGTPESWREVRPPDDLPPCYGASNAGYYFPWLTHTLGTRS